METGLTIPTPPRAQATARTLQKGHDCERQVSLLTALGTAAVVADKQTKAPKRFHYYIPFVGAVSHARRMDIGKQHGNAVNTNAAAINEALVVVWFSSIAELVGELGPVRVQIKPQGASKQRRYFSNADHALLPPALTWELLSEEYNKYLDDHYVDTPRSSHSAFVRILPKRCPTIRIRSGRSQVSDICVIYRARMTTEADAIETETFARFIRSGLAEMTVQRLLFPTPPVSGQTEPASRTYNIFNTVTSGFSLGLRPPRLLDCVYVYETMGKSYLSDVERKAVIDELLRISENGKLPRGAYAKVASGVERDPTTISTIWKRYVAAVEAGVVGGEWKSRRKRHCGRKRKNRDELREKLARVPMEDRAVERRAAAAAGVSRHLVRQAVREGMLKRRTVLIKPALTPENKLRRVEHALSFIDDRTLEFESMHNGEKPPPRFWKSKRFIPNTMFLAALARPRYDPHRKQQWDDKLGVWSFTEKYEAQRSSKNRAKGAVCTRNIDTVDREVYREYLVTKVFPAIKAQWPRKDRHMLILVQQDNAKLHVEPWDPDVVKAGQEGGWSIRMLCQAPNSPDLNTLDLGVFNAMQTLQYYIPRKGIDALIASVNTAFSQLKSDTVNDIFLTLQACMLASLREEGGNVYKLPHLKKAKLRRAKCLPTSLKCSRELYESAVALLAASDRGSALLFGKK
ncbi:hypothetical protein, variant [Phytophthora nicotianae P10297]|uniref:DUF7769 domain-containing protein n=1 Tax=Phytophthora nicotianae P10297 TaxID=1317064 RepID=W2Y747_PHYNI|nr:hypothetical protein, variant [Phytophthora nicotianae P10297]